MLRTYRGAARWYGEAVSECQPGYLAAIRAPCPKKIAAKQAVARKSNRKWMSPGSQEFSANLKGDKRALKVSQNPVWDVPKPSKIEAWDGSGGQHEALKLHTAAKRQPRAPKNCPRDAQEAPKRGQEPPKSEQKPAK